MPDQAMDMERADASVAARFSRVMNASTSPIGALSDPPLVGIASGALLVAYVAARQLGGSEVLQEALLGLTALPILVAILVSLTLLGARRRLVAWLAGLPFPVENMNALLNGLGELLEVTFAESYPPSPELNVELDKVSPDSFVTNQSEETKTVDVRIGVIESKRNPARTNHLRFVRVERLVRDVLVPLNEKHPIVGVRIK